MPSFPLNFTLGPIINGAFFTVFFFGLICMQTTNYFKQFPNDILLLKCVVVFLWALQLVYTACICQGAYTMSVTDFGSIFSLFNTPWGLNVGVVVGSIIDHSVQVFFVTRIYRVTGLLSVSIALGIIVVFLQGVSFSLAAEAIRSDSIIVVGERWNWLLTVLFFGDAGLDITTSLVLCYFLKKKGRTAFKSTTVLLDRLVVYTLQTGLTTSFVALGAAISFKAAPHYFIWTGFFMAMPGSFMSALLANINNRKNLVPSSSAGTGSANQSLGGIQISRNIVLSRDDIDPTNLAKSDTDVADNSMELTKLSAQQGVYGTSTV